MGKSVRPEDIVKMTKLEIESMSEKASKLFDTFTKETRVNINIKQAFILGYLHGREQSLDEMGIFDDDDDDSKIYKFIMQNPSRANRIDDDK
jgi:hypothetical protein